MGGGEGGKCERVAQMYNLVPLSLLPGEALEPSEHASALPLKVALWQYF